jgi:hypothetical protein
MYRTITTLHEYRTLYPGTAAVPTLTQSGLLGLLLDRQRYKAARLAQRHAKWRAVCAAPRNFCVGIWRVLTMSDLRRGFRPTPNHAEVAAQHQA